LIDPPIELDERRGMAAQKATERRRLVAGLAADRAKLLARDLVRCRRKGAISTLAVRGDIRSGGIRAARCSSRTFLPISIGCSRDRTWRVCQATGILRSENDTAAERPDRV
jgi:hypothetical protein